MFVGGNKLLSYERKTGNCVLNVILKIHTVYLFKTYVVRAEFIVLRFCFVKFPCRQD